MTYNTVLRRALREIDSRMVQAVEAEAYETNEAALHARSLKILETERGASLDTDDLATSVMFTGSQPCDMHNGRAMYMGLEIEGAPRTQTAEALQDYIYGNHRDNTQLFGTKEDGSLRDGFALEIATTKATLSEMRTNVMYIMENMGHLMVSNPTIDLCALDRAGTPHTSEHMLMQWGMHVHIGWHCIADDSKRYVTERLEVQRTGYIAMALFRHLNTLCRKIGGRGKTRWDAGVTSTNLKSIQANSLDRGAVNAFSRHDTIEFRFGRGKFDYNHTVGFIELCHALFKFAHEITTNNLDRLVLSVPHSMPYHLRDAAHAFYFEEGQQLMVWSRENELLQRKALNQLFCQWVQQHAEYYELLPALVDSYYSTDGAHFLKTSRKNNQATKVENLLYSGE